MNGLYLIIAQAGLQKDDYVFLGNLHDMYGRVCDVELENYTLPNPCTISHQGNMVNKVDITKSLSLYTVRGFNQTPFVDVHSTISF